MLLETCVDGVGGEVLSMERPSDWAEAVELFEIDRRDVAFFYSKARAVLRA